MMKMMIMTRENNHNYLIDSDCPKYFTYFSLLAESMFLFIIGKSRELIFKNIKNIPFYCSIFVS